MTNVNWIPCDGELLPRDRQRVLFYRPHRLATVGEMVYYKQEKKKFLDINSHWAPKLEKPRVK